MVYYAYEHSPRLRHLVPQPGNSNLPRLPAARRAGHELLLVEWTEARHQRLHAHFAAARLHVQHDTKGQQLPIC